MVFVSYIFYISGVVSDVRVGVYASLVILKKLNSS